MCTNTCPLTLLQIMKLLLHCLCIKTSANSADLVETPEGHHWKRHADQMKSVITVSEETASEAEFPLEVTPPPTPPTNLSTDSPDPPVDISDPPNVGNESEGSSTSEEPTSRYPTRTRRPPERFQ